MKHTPTPWKTHEPYSGFSEILSPNDSSVLGLNELSDPVCIESNDANRIVECVNAMEGIQDPMSYLKQQSASIVKLQREKRELEELLETLNGIWKKGESINPTSIMAKAVDYQVSK